MKLIYVVIDGMADLPIKELQDRTPLGAAHTPNMDSLASNGKTGLMYTVGKGIAPESDVGVISILGYDPFKYSTGRGVLEAVGAGLPMKNGDLALRCNFATMGREFQIIDRRAGRDLTSEEARALAEAVNKKVKLETCPSSFDFRSTTGHRAVLVIKPKKSMFSSNITNTDPGYTRLKGLGVAEKNVEMVLKKCEPIEKTEKAKISAEVVNEFTIKSHEVLDGHEINQIRAEQGKLKANVILSRDAGHLLPKFFKLDKRYGVSFACLADMPVERGIAKLAGMHLVDLPPPSNDLKKDCLIRVEKLLDALSHYDCFYIHIKGPDEPAHDGNFQRKTQLITVVDEFFFGELLPKLDLRDHLICVTADHATPCKMKAHSDDPVPVLISGDRIRGDKIPKFSEKDCHKGSLGILRHGTQLMPKLMSLIEQDKTLRKG